MTELINLIAAASSGYAGHVAAEIKEVLYAVHDPETDTRVISDSSGRLVAGLRTTPYDPGHESAVHALHAAAFGELPRYQSRSLDTWAAPTTRSDLFQPDLSRVALADNETVGFVVSYGTGIAGRFYIGQVGTARAWRGRGVATAMLGDVLAAGGRTGYTHATLDTDADNRSRAAAVYAKVGFDVDHRAVAYRKAIQP